MSARMRRRARERLSEYVDELALCLARETKCGDEVYFSPFSLNRFFWAL